ncbi:BolA family transcriptional regulator [Bartonella sp. HY329]|uniref:BolA family protein n=1 Tax=unclassified Bartonella TaxID=2645622 RepID=UPI0021C5FD32|nr:MULTISPECIES: BolA family protein [unclassified Bartonella]UXM95124.1 BolA family transcriptional regulator [Bartonella sp. HY329]UXN09447.1 BolA family transcriptional regulator [Bartonella sp. HY328]
MSSTIKEIMEKKLRAVFTPQHLEVINESALHAGHSHDDGSSFDGEGETHFRIKITSSEFVGMKRVEQHRAINDVLKDELADKVHALAIEAQATP